MAQESVEDLNEEDELPPQKLLAEKKADRILY